MWHNSSACHVYVMWAELGHSHFLYVPAVSNVATGNGTDTKNVYRALGFVFSVQSSVYGAITVAKVYYLPGHGLLKFLLYACVEIDPFSYEQTSVI